MEKTSGRTPIAARVSFRLSGLWDSANHGEAQCPAEGCDGDRAYFYQVQIRSADEPMTTFLRVSFPPSAIAGSEDLTAGSVRRVPSGGERTDGGGCWIGIIACKASFTDFI